MRNSFLPTAFLLITLAGTKIVNANVELISFDDIPANPSFASVANGYAGLNWNNFLVADSTTTRGNGGYVSAAVSSPNFVLNGFGSGATISSTGEFDLRSAYITAAWRTGLDVEVKGYADGLLLDDITIQPSPTSATLYTFDFDHVDTVDFISSGGTLYPGYSGENPDNSEQFALDNLTVNLDDDIPEPSISMMILEGLCLYAFLRIRGNFAAFGAAECKQIHFSPCDPSLIEKVLYSLRDAKHCLEIIKDSLRSQPQKRLP